MREASALVAHDGSRVALPTDRWHGEATPEEREALAWAVAPVLDVGCGPGRHVLSLARQGKMALGVDASPLAADTARARGAPVLQRSVFDRLPGSRRWASALLFDGNIGIGGDPAALLRRLGVVLRADGRVIVELEGPGEPTVSCRVRVEAGGATGPWFRWATVGVDGIDDLAGRAGFALEDAIGRNSRWFACLRRS